MKTVISPPDATSVAATLQRAGIPRAEGLAALASPSIRIKAARIAGELLRIGASRFGGTPDLPADFAWPERSGRALAFLAQLDLSEIVGATLPANGWLLFFYDAVNQPWGNEGADAGSAHVAYLDAARESLGRRPHPSIDPGGGPFEPCKLDFLSTVDLPHEWDRLIDGSGLTIAQSLWGAYATAASSLNGYEEGHPHQPYHHLLGHPQLVQDDMREQCELLANGFEVGSPEDRKRGPEELHESAAKWTLLMQIDTDETGPGWMWGDVGRLYFWIRRSDLVAGDFGRVSLVLQCG